MVQIKTIINKRMDTYDDLDNRVNDFLKENNNKITVINILRNVDGKNELNMVTIVYEKIK